MKTGSSPVPVRQCAARRPSPDSIPKSFRRIGAYYCLASSLCYTISFVLVRSLAERVHPDWIFCVKESVSFITTFAFILVLTFRRKYSWPSPRVIGLVLAAGFFNEFFGGRLRIWAFAVLGLVLANPLIQISTILTTLLLGAVFLSEKISLKKWSAFGIFTTAIVLISVSQTGMEPLIQDSLPGTQLGWGIVLVLLSGLGYTIFYLTIRKISKKESRDAPTPLPATFTVCFVCGVGALTCGAGFFAREGAHAFIIPSAACWGFGLAAGIAEMTAFLLLNTGLRYATASKVAMISVSQLIFLTFLGQFFFHEPTNLFVWIGVALTCVGILMTTDLD
ncbi:MAG: DMT family transporter [Thermoguttaceae bacterium]|nr:DMT family transporter [Thermoguttaceae bacterium]